jgi:sugar lactone lactonase YvrE
MNFVATTIMCGRLLWPPIFLLIATSVSAHPGIGIVMDSRGNVFYTDLKQVWKVSPDGKKTIAVRNVHTHELCLDVEDNIYGEHLWYEGEATEKWGHYVWKLHADGTLELVRDRAGNMYWADRGAPTIIRKRTPDGTIMDFCKTHDFRDVRWMVASAGGTVYLIDDENLCCITPDGTVKTIAHHLKERRLFEFFFGDQHNLMGLWLDAEDNVYIAVMGGQMVKRVGRDGRIEVVARSSAPWSPTGGLVAPIGDLWLLEYSTTNTARVRRIERDGSEKIY